MDTNNHKIIDRWKSGNWKQGKTGENRDLGRKPEESFGIWEIEKLVSGEVESDSYGT